MKNTLQFGRGASWLGTLLVSFVLAACGSGDQGRDPILGVDAAQLTTVSVTPAQGSVPIGGAQQFVATATYSDGSSRDVTTGSAWSSATTANATINASTGVATGVAAGSAVISASYSGKSGSATLTVLPATLVSMTIAPLSTALNIGLTQQYTAAGIYTDGSARNISALAAFSSVTPATATITATGLATAVAAGTTVITATVGTMNATTLLTVNAPTLLSLALTPANPALAVGATQQLATTATYSSGSPLVVTTTATYASSAPTVATVSANGGLVTAVAAGTTVVTASFGGKTTTTTVTVSPAVVVPPAVTLSSIAVTPATATASVGSTQAFVATATYSDGSTANISSTAAWTSNTTSVATVLAGGSASALAAGTSTITATSGGKSGSATFTVTAVVVPPPALATIDLAGATTFGVLAGNSITNNSGGTTVVTGDIGSPSQTVDPVQTAGYVNYKSGLPLTLALTGLQLAITDANSRACNVSSAAGIDLGGLTLGPGVYCYAGAISITGTFTMNGPGLYIFRSASTLDTVANAIVALNGGATADNVFWVPSGATTLGAMTVFKGTVMAQSSAITLGDGASLQNGRVLSGSAVTLRNNVISK